MSTLMVDSENVSEEKPLMCAVCFQTFKRKDHMKHHIILKRHILHEPNNTLPENLGITLPKSWKYGAFKMNTNNSSLAFFTYDLHTKEDVVKWMKSYMEENKSKFVCVQVRSLKTRKHFRYQCEHRKDYNRHHKYKKIKGTGCKCAIFFSLSRGLANVGISHLHHNHSLTSAVITSFHTPTEDVKRIFLEMFNNGASPAEALNHYKNYIKSQGFDDIEYFKFCADRSKMPNYRWVHHLYKAQLKEKYASTKSHEVIKELKRYINYTNSQVPDPICKYKEVVEGNFIVAIMGPCINEQLLSSEMDDFVHPLSPVLDEETKPATDNKSVPEDFLNPLHPIKFKGDHSVTEVTAELENRCEHPIEFKSEHLVTETTTELEDRCEHPIEFKSEQSVIEEVIELEDRCEHPIEFKSEQSVIEEVIELEEHCEEIQTTITENNETLELQQEGENEIERFSENCEKLRQVMFKNPAMYTSALKSFNKHLTDMIIMHNHFTP